MPWQGINAYLLHVSKGSLDGGRCTPLGGHGVGLTPGAAQAPRCGLGSALGCGAIGTTLALLRPKNAQHQNVLSVQPEHTLSQIAIASGAVVSRSREHSSCR